MKNKKLAAILMIAVLLVSVFVFAACENPVVKVIFKDLNPKYETDENVEKYIIVGEKPLTADMEMLPVSKVGYALEAWTTDEAGLDVFDPTQTYTANVVVYAKWHKLPAMPTNLAYDVDNNRVQWSAVAGATGYLVQLDDNEPSLVTTTFADLPETISNGNHTVKVTAKENDYSSPTANLTFSVVREQPKQYVSFYVSDDSLPIVRQIIDGSVELPANPSVVGYAFDCWTLDKEGSQPFVNESLTESLDVYAQFKKLPDKVAPAYNPNTQRIEWSYSATDAAFFEVEFNNTNRSISAVDGQTAYFFELSDELTENASYTIKITTVSKNQIGGVALKSEEISLSFTYVVIREDTVKVTFMVDGTEHSVQVVNQNGTVTLPQNPTKLGFIFGGWTMDVQGKNAFENENIIESVTVYAQWTARPAAPDSVSFDPTAATVSWDEIDGIEEYWYKLDGALNFTRAQGLSFEVFTLSAGNHTVVMKTVSGGIESEEVSLAFDADALYVWFRNADGSFISSARVENGSVTLPADPERTGFVFAKWTVGRDFKTNKFDNKSISTFLSVYAQFVTVPEIGAYEINGVNYVWEWTADANVNFYEVKFDSQSAITKRAAIADGVATYILDSTTVILELGDHKLFVTAVDDAGNKVFVKEYEFTVQFESELSYVDGDGKLIREDVGDKSVFVFFVGSSYRFDSYTFVLPGTEEFYSVSGDNSNILTINKVSTSITILTANDLEISAKFVYPVSAFTAGDSIEAFRNNTGENSLFLKKEGSYAVGIANDFILDLDLISRGSALAPSNIELTYTLKSADGVQADASEYFNMIVNDDGTYRLAWKDNVDLEGGKTDLVLSVRPKYLFKSQNDTASDFTVVFEMSLNDGVNVYDNAGLKKAFADVSVGTINIHGDITAALDANQINADGSAVNYSNYRGQPAGTVDGSVYYRVATTTDELTVNGNFFTIDASKKDADGNLLVPRVYRRKASIESDGKTGQAEPNGLGSDVQNVQIALFTVYNDASDRGETAVDTIYKNLHIIGNTQLIGTDEKSIATYSGGHNGIATKDSSAEINNVYAHNFTIAFFVSSTGQRDVTLRDCFADQSWANSVYAHTSAKIRVIGCDFRASSGAGIHIEDPVRETGEYLDPWLYVEDTKINNWIAGDEAWFTAWGVSGAATQIKTTAQNAVKEFGYSLLRSMGTAEKMNFAIMFKPTDSNWDVTQTSRFKYDFKDSKTGEIVSGLREYNWWGGNLDARIQSQSFLFPVGQYSPLEAFAPLANQVGAECTGAASPDLISKIMYNGITVADAVAAAGGDIGTITALATYAMYNYAMGRGYELADGQMLCEVVQPGGGPLGGNVNSLASIFVAYGNGEGWI